MDYISNLLLLQSTLIALKENHPRRRATNDQSLLMGQELWEHLEDLVTRERASLDPVGFIWNYFGGNPNGDVKISKVGDVIEFSYARIDTAECITDLVRGYPMVALGGHDHAILEVDDIDPSNIDIYIKDGKITVHVNAERYIDVIYQKQQ
jgi:hypothetical protein